MNSFDDKRAPADRFDGRFETYEPPVSPTPSPRPSSAQAPTEPQKPVSSRTGLSETLLAWGMLLVSLFFVEMRAFSEHPLGVLLAMLAISLVGWIYLRKSGIRRSRQSLLGGVLFLLLTLSFFTNGNAGLRGWILFLLLLSIPFRALDAAGLAEQGLFSLRVFWHALRSLILLPFRGVARFFSSLFKWDTPSSQKTGRAILWGLLGLVTALIPTAIIVLLLSYDKLFTDMLGQIFSFRRFGRTLLSLILAPALAMLLFSALHTAKRAAKREIPLPDRSPSVGFLPCALLCGAVTPILLVYILFFISQMPYYLSAFTGVLPEGLTFADYAKDGFFQLCAVSAINALLLLGFSLFMQKGGAARNILKTIYSSILSLLTLVLIATALSKMALYIRSYGLTQKRVYASWLMLLLAALFVAALIRQFVRRFPLAPVLAVTILVFLLVIALLNVDGLIATYNVNAYLSGALPEVDVAMLRDEIGISAAPALVKLEQSLSAIPAPSAEQSLLLSSVRNTLDGMRKTLSETSFFGLSLPTILAKIAVG